MTDGEEKTNLVVEDRNDPHRTLVVLYIITILVAVVAAFAFK